MSDTATIKTTDALASLFGDTAKIVRTSEVTIPSDVRALFDRAVPAFASAPNTARVTESKADAKAAETYARQIRQYAKETGRTALVTVTGTDVCWRFSTVTPSVRGKSRKVNPVTVTQITPNAA